MAVCVCVHVIPPTSMFIILVSLTFTVDVFHFVMVVMHTNRYVAVCDHSVSCVE